MIVLETERLVLRRLTVEDAEFILGLLNEPSFVRFIGDRGVRTMADAREYILKGAIGSYERHGFGMYLTELKEDRTPLGICGLLRRESLQDVDIGFALMPQFWARGYAYESASAVMAYGRSTLGLKRVVAVTTPDNHGSLRVLGKLGMRFEQMVKLSEDGPELELHGCDF
ncbi:MAG: GCN5 family acetyltransferase [Gemmatimonas sp. SG8_17]|nr:MAG: GCN5 family acetyltransferase [Gemmatimonas sp. SG8_17]